MHAIMLSAIARRPVARQLQSDKIRHGAAASQIAACAFAVARHIGEPFDRSALHGHCGRPDGVRAQILVQR